MRSLGPKAEGSSALHRYVAPVTDVPPFYQRPPQTAGKATAALVFAILAWFVCPVIPAIVALVLASQADGEIRASGGALTGESLLTAARIIAWINIALLGFVIVGATLAITFLGSTSTDKLSNIGSTIERVAVTVPAGAAVAAVTP